MVMVRWGGFFQLSQKNGVIVAAGAVYYCRCCSFGMAGSLNDGGGGDFYLSTLNAMFSLSLLLSFTQFMAFAMAQPFIFPFLST